MTLKELISRIKVVAVATTRQEVRPELLDNDVLIEVVLPRCLDEVASKVARTPDGLQALRRSVTVAFVNGVGPMPARLKQEHIATVTFTDDPLTSYVPNFDEFQMSGSPTDCSKFTVRNGSIYYNQLGQSPGTFTGSRAILALLRPVLPATLATAVDLEDHLVNQLVTYTAGVVSGQVPLSEIGLDYESLETARNKVA